MWPYSSLRKIVHDPLPDARRQVLFRIETNGIQQRNGNDCNGGEFENSDLRPFRWQI